MTVRNRTILPLLLLLVLILSGCQFSWPWQKRVDLTRATPDGLY